MRRGRILGIVLILGLASAGTVLAEEVVHFTNGTFMPIRSHTIEDGMVRVVLGAESEMAFPIGLVEKIESNGREIIIRSAAANVVQGGALGGGPARPAEEAEDGEVEIIENANQYTASGADSPSGPAAQNLSQQQQALANAGIANPGLVNGFVQGGIGGSKLGGGEPGGANVSRPFADSSNPAKRAVTAVGDRTLNTNRSVGTAPGVPSGESLRGATLQPGGSRPRND